MYNSDWFEMHVYRIIGIAPTILVMVVGVILALRNLPRHPRPCWLLLGSLALSFFNNLGMPFILPLFLDFLNNAFGVSRVQDGIFRIAYTLPYSIIAAISWGLIFAAVFDRPDRPKFLTEDPDRDIMDR